MSIILVNQSFQCPVGLAENMLVEVGKFTFLVDFVILEMEEDSKVPLILGRPFLHTTDVVIHVKQKQLNLGVGSERMIFSIVSVMKHFYSNDDSCFSIEKKQHSLDLLEHTLIGNAPAAFQRCMLAIFHDMIEESVVVFIDDFSVFVNSFHNCLNILDKILARCKDTSLVLKREKCHFMVKEQIILGHKVSGAGLEVDKEKIDVISKLPSPTNVKGIRSFLGHAGYYHRFIKDFSKTARPLTKLLEKDTPV
ncbi:reverse transcriptase domain-containing protein [Tanacetum coccineum]